MKDKGILFSAPMVRALIAGRKTQTRRIINPQPGENVTSAGVISRSTEGQTDEWTWLSGDPRDCDSWMSEGDFRTGYRPGQRLWVRETWGCHWATDNQKPRDISPELWSVFYPADRAMRPARCDGGYAQVEQIKRLRPAIFMPRWASRLWLTIEAVRVERLQEIGFADAEAEGCEIRQMWLYGLDAEGRDAVGRRAYQTLWESINGPDSWKANPFVVALTFKVAAGNIDEVTQ